MDKQKNCMTPAFKHIVLKKMFSCVSPVSLQEKVLLWLLQFMQEQAISLDEVDQKGNTAVHVAAQYGHLTCIQVRY